MMHRGDEQTIYSMPQAFLVQKSVEVNQMIHAIEFRRRLGGVTLGLLAVLLGGILPFTGGVMAGDKSVEEQPYRVVLLGASIGRTWNLSAFPERMHDKNYVVESFAVWQFDKSETLEEILMRPERKFHMTATYFKSLFQAAPQLPNAVILKECSAYFPGDPRQQKELVKKWVDQVRHAGIQPILATAVPVTRSRAEKDKGKMDGIREYNDWIRNYAKDQRIPLLDLERALRIDPVERYLKDDFTSGDGSHLNGKAYEILDRLLYKTLTDLQKEVGTPRIVKK